MLRQSTSTLATPTGPLNIERLLIVRLGSMGDIIHALPAVWALRQQFSEAMLGWLIEERWAELLCTLPTPRSGRRSPQRPLVDRIHVVDTKKWRSAPLSTQTWEQVAAGLSHLRAARYEVAVDLQGGIRSALFARWSGAPLVCGAAQPRESGASMFYTRKVLTRGDHVVEQNRSLAEAAVRTALNLPRVEFPRDEAAEQERDRWLEQCGIKDFVLLAPAAGWGAKQWPAERYACVAQRLAHDDLKSLITFGPGETELAQKVEAMSNGVAEAVSGSITQLISLTRRARLFIGGDTGPMHLAAAMRIPVVGIFGPTNPARNGPYGTHSIVLRSPASITSHKRRAEPEQGLLEISVEAVVKAARELLGSRCG
jgi:heptosyltransferase I